MGRELFFLITGISAAQGVENRFIGGPVRRFPMRFHPDQKIVHGAVDFDSFIRGAVNRSREVGSQVIVGFDDTRDELF